MISGQFCVTSTHPFKPETHPEGKILMNISSGLVATQEVQNSLLSAVDNGKKKMDSFLDSRLSTEGNVGFYVPIARSKLLTFSDI